MDLGIDIGSRDTKMVLMENGKVDQSQTLPTPSFIRAHRIKGGGRHWRRYRGKPGRTAVRGAEGKTSHGDGGN